MLRELPRPNLHKTHSPETISDAAIKTADQRLSSLSGIKRVIADRLRYSAKGALTAGLALQLLVTAGCGNIQTPEIQPPTFELPKIEFPKPDIKLPDIPVPWSQAAEATPIPAPEPTQKPTETPTAIPTPKAEPTAQTTPIATPKKIETPTPEALKSPQRLKPLANRGPNGEILNTPVMPPFTAEQRSTLRQVSEYYIDDLMRALNPNTNAKLFQALNEFRTIATSTSPSEESDRRLTYAFTGDINGDVRSVVSPHGESMIVYFHLPSGESIDPHSSVFWWTGFIGNGFSSSWSFLHVNPNGELQLKSRKIHEGKPSPIPHDQTEAALKKFFNIPPNAALKGEADGSVSASFNEGDTFRSWNINTQGSASYGYSSRPKS